MNGKVIVITGAAQGLGAAYAAHLGAQGAHVVVADINEAGARAVADGVTGKGGRATAVRMDVTDEDSVRSVMAAVAAEAGPVEVLVNNAGGLFGWDSSENTTLDNWNRTVALCLTSAWLCAREVIPAMKAAKSGRIINIVTATADRGLPLNMPAYIAAKGGVAALTRALARELGPFGITVNGLSPGLFVMDKGAEVQAIAEGIVKDQSIPRPGVPDDLLGALTLLASDQSSFITGQVLTVDGGWAFR